MQDEMNDLQYTKEEDPDIVRVVRCKNCIDYQTDWETRGGKHYCATIDCVVEPNDYCSYGQRK